MNEPTYAVPPSPQPGVRPIGETQLPVALASFSVRIAPVNLLSGW